MLEEEQRFQWEINEAKRRERARQTNHETNNVFEDDEDEEDDE